MKTLIKILLTLCLFSLNIYCLGNTFLFTKIQQTVSANDSTIDTSNATITKTSYNDDNIQITISTIEEYDTIIYIADIYINDPSFLKTALAQNAYGTNVTETTSSIAESNNAILAINGDYYGANEAGYVIKNGVLYRDTIRQDETQDLAIYEDGTFEIIDENEITAQELLDNGVIQTLAFGPGLIEDGEIIVDTNAEVNQSMSSNPRTAIGYVEENHYIFMVSDGRTDESAGLTLYQVAQIMKEYNCQIAYNLDGGGSSTMVFNGEVINKPTTSGKNIEEREVSDIVYIG